MLGIRNSRQPQLDNTGMGSLGTPARAAGTPMAAAGGSMMGVVSGLGATAARTC